MAELPGLRAALQEHEARLAAQQEKLLLASLEQFFGRPALLGAVAPATADEEQHPSALDAIVPASRENSCEAREKDLATERIWWSEAIKGLFLQQMQQLRGCVVEEGKKQTRALNELQGCLAAGARPGADDDHPGAPQQGPGQAQKGDAHWQPPQGREAQEVPRAGATQGSLEAMLEQEVAERRASDAGTREVIERQGGALRDLSRAVAGLEALLRPVEVDKPGAVAEEESRTRSHVSSDHLDWTRVASDDDSRDSDNVALQSTIAERRVSNIIHEGNITTVKEARQYGKAICHSRHFILFTACMILSNSILLGIETNETMTSPELNAPDGFGYRIANLFFALVFLLELAIRWFSDGARFLSPRNSEFLWNCFDTLLIAIAVAEEILVLFAVDMAIIPLGFLRLSRLIRLTRMMRAFKLVREFKELRIMATGLMNSVRPIFWASVLIVFLTYMTSVFISQILADYQRAADDTDLDTERTIKFIDNNFSNLGECMYTLFEALTGGRDWGELAAPFRHIHWMLVMCLVLYIIIGVFCILNLLTAVFLEAAQRIDDVTEHIYAKRDWTNHIKCFFLNAVDDMSKSNGDLSTERITRASFIKLMKSRKTVKFLEDNGMDLCFTDESRVGELFDIMDEDGNGELDVNEFVKSLYNLKGPARALDLKLEHQKTMSLITSLQDCLGSVRTGGCVSRNSSIRNSGVISQAGTLQV